MNTKSELQVYNELREKINLTKVLKKENCKNVLSNITGVHVVILFELFKYISKDLCDKKQGFIGTVSLVSKNSYWMIVYEPIEGVVIRIFSQTLFLN